MVHLLTLHTSLCQYEDLSVDVNAALLYVHRVPMGLIDIGATEQHAIRLQQITHASSPRGIQNGTAART